MIKHRYPSQTRSVIRSDSGLNIDIRPGLGQYDQIQDNT